MSSSQTLSAQQQLKTMYLLIHLILFIPVLLLPVPILIFQNPMLNEFILPKWSVSITLLLMTSAVMDSFLHHFNQQEKVLSAILWVSLLSLFILQNLGNAWFLALLFIFHSMRSTFILFKNSVADTKPILPWLRDSSVALVIFLWLHFLG